ncbi:HK97-gp10 family putative phage morphogenesis protein [Roseibium sp. RKSG952]|uniref:HK97-gp10 family putative phage morphogenesis protein n=1 Tax=Roseibium sp. RKSG952 TaxID=2529384 RepID=UPI0012BC5F15|nr:HK97-gp10 family putative phage morphogenesis protein [Roseibium sp. RKSG952]MTH96645.1 hypothetical protein [Roseibium sp. RKSG952]
MPDRVIMRSPKLDATMARIRKIAPKSNEYLEQASERSAKELAKLASSAAPRVSGDLADSIKAKKTEDYQSAWGVYAIWRWMFTEFGTSTKAAQPFLFPIYRLLKKKHLGRARRALNKAVKEAMGK